MSENKSLSAFIKKNKKTKKPAEKTEAPVQETAKAQEVKQKAEEAKQIKNTPNAHSSSDEEEDELDVASKQLSYGTIKEKKDLASKGGEEGKKLGFGFEEQQAIEKDPPKDAKKTQKFGDAPMNFSRPKFSRKAPGKFGGQDFNEGLDDLDDEGNVKRREARKPAEGGQKEFINLGSSARPAKDEEEKQEKRAPAVKPKFTGKLNLTKTGAGDQEHNEGVTKTYDFGVVFKTQHKEGEGEEHKKHEKRERKEGETGEPQRQRKPREKGRPFGEKKDDDADDDFQVVKDHNRKQHKKRFHDDDSSDEEERGQGGSRGGRGFRRTEGEAIRGGARVERGGNRGGRGDRGGILRRD